MTSYTRFARASATFLRSRWAVAIVLALVIALVGWFLLVAPVPIAFIVVVAGATAWCIWLDRHPESQ